MLTEKIQSIDLADTVRGYGVDLRPGGSGRLKGLCPFHAEKTPSFVIYQNKQKHTWRCFGCGKSGDVADFIVEYEGITLKEALRRLGLTERIDSDKLKHQKKRAAAVKGFRAKCKQIAYCLGLLMQIWESHAKDPEYVFDHPFGYDYYNYWWDRQESLILGSDEARYGVVQEVTVNKLVSQSRKLGWL